MQRVLTARFTCPQQGQHRLKRSIVSPLVIVVLCALVVSGCDWTTFGFGPDHTRFNYGESTIGASNVGSLVPLFTAGGSTSYDPTVANGLLYTSSGVYDATGNKNCSGSPKVCSPLWSLQMGGTSATVVNGVLFTTVVINNSVLPPVNTPYLYAYDASGNTNCSGTPKVCAPLWTSTLGGSSPTGVVSAPTVAEGKVFVGDDQYLFAFDAAGGNAHCSGTPRTCTALWAAPVGDVGAVSTPAVSDGVVYAGTDYVEAFNDSTGAKLWSSPGTYGTESPLVPLVVSNGFVYSDIGNYIEVFDAAGVTNCSGTPTVCTPVWRVSTSSSLYGFEAPAVADNVLYASASDGNLYAYDAGGITNCTSGTTRECSPIWSASTVSPGSDPSVANGVVYVASSHADKIFAFDASGTTNCAGTPKICTPLWSASTSGSSSNPSIANGMLYDGDHAWGLSSG